MRLGSALAGVGDDCLTAAEFRKFEAGLLNETRATHFDRCNVCRELLDLRMPKDVPSLVDGLLADALKDGTMEISTEEDEKLTSMILGMLSRAYDLKIGKDITKEKLEAAFADRPELKNLKAALVAFFKAAIH